MCRLAAYRGPELFLDQLINEEPHSLVTQSWASRELSGTTLNADGFGVGWYINDNEPAIYTNTLPIWADVNLAGLGKSLSSRTWLAYIRSATPGQAVSQANTQPFSHKHIMYLHNGRIEQFNAGPRAALHRFLDADIQAEIQGNTDSEYLFALFRHFLVKENSIRAALLKCCHETGRLLEGPALLTTIISDGRDFFCCRHSVNGAHCPTLYYTNGHPNFPRALVIASSVFPTMITGGKYRRIRACLRVKTKRRYWHYDSKHRKIMFSCVAAILANAGIQSDNVPPKHALEWCNPGAALCFTGFWLPPE